MKKILDLAGRGTFISWLVLIIGAIFTILSVVYIQFRSEQTGELRLELIGANVRTMLANSLDHVEVPAASDSSLPGSGLAFKVKKVVAEDTSLTALIKLEKFGLSIYTDPNLSKESLIVRSAGWDSTSEFRSFVLPLIYGKELLVLRLADLNDEKASESRIRIFLTFGFGLFASVLFFLITMSFIRANQSKQEEARELLEKFYSSEERFEAIFRSLPDPAVLIDMKKGTIEEINDQAMAEYGYIPEEIINADCTLLSGEPEKSKAVLRTSQKTVPLRFHKRKDGSLFPAEIRLGKLTLGGEEKTIALIRNADERVRKEEELLESLKKQTKEKELLEQQLAGSSFNFRTPLSIILSSLYILKDYPERLTDQEREFHLNQIITNIQSLMTMLEESPKN